MLEKRKQAALKIQSHVRGHIARKSVNESKKRNHSAQVIQRGRYTNLCHQKVCHMCNIKVLTISVVLNCVVILAMTVQFVE